MDKYDVVDRNGNTVRIGDEITDFRGDTSFFQGVSRGPEYNGTAKVLVTASRDADVFSRREYYARVFDLSVTPKP